MPRLIAAAVSVVLSVWAVTGAWAACGKAFVRAWEPGARLAAVTGPPSERVEAGAVGPADRQGAALLAQARPGTVTLEWLGHSSFLITSPRGVRALTDPNQYAPTVQEPHVVTVSNEHFTHNRVESVPGTPRILRPVSPDGRWIPVRAAVRDVEIFNLASRRNAEWAGLDSRNSIFIFDVDGLCIAHLGNIGHLLTDEQVQALGRIDVVLAPIDSHFTLGYPDLLTVLEKIRPALVVPMHYDNPNHPQLFISFLQGRYPVRLVPERRLVLTREGLPPRTTLVVLGAGAGSPD